MKTSNSKQPSHPILRACKLNHFEHVSHAQTHISERHHVQTNQSCAPIAEQRYEPRTWKCSYQRPDSQQNEEFCYRSESFDEGLNFWSGLWSKSWRWRRLGSENCDRGFIITSILDCSVNWNYHTENAKLDEPLITNPPLNHPLLFSSQIQPPIRSKTINRGPGDSVINKCKTPPPHSNP